jgi:hypothetical protein
MQQPTHMSAIASQSSSNHSYALILSAAQYSLAAESNIAHAVIVLKSFMQFQWRSIP